MLTDHDHDMIAHASDRGRVLVETRYGVKEATLISWKRKRKSRPNDVGRESRRPDASVMFASGKRASFNIKYVHKLNPPNTHV